MKKDSGYKVKLGMFVTVGIVLLLIAVWYIGQRQRIFANTISIQCVFDDVNGLQTGNNIRFAGINVGTVERIEIISDTSVNVVMLIDKPTKKFIKTDSKAVIGSEGLMGNKNILILPGTAAGQEIKDDGTIEALPAPSLDDILMQFQVAAENVAYVTEDLADITGNIRAGRGTIGMLLMDSTMAGDIEQTLDNVKESSGGLKNSFLFKNYFKKRDKAKEEKAKPNK